MKPHCKSSNIYIISVQIIYDKVGETRSELFFVQNVTVHSFVIFIKDLKKLQVASIQSSRDRPELVYSFPVFLQIAMYNANLNQR